MGFPARDEILLRVRFGEPQLPHEPISPARFVDTVERPFRHR